MRYFFPLYFIYCFCISLWPSVFFSSLISASNLFLLFFLGSFNLLVAVTITITFFSPFIDVPFGHFFFVFGKIYRSLEYSYVLLQCWCLQWRICYNQKPNDKNDTYSCCSGCNILCFDHTFSSTLDKPTKI